MPKTKKPKEVKPASLMQQAERGIVAVFDDSTAITVNGKVKAIDEGTAFLLKSVEVIAQGRLRLSAVEGGVAEVSTRDVRIYMGNVPDWRMELYLVGHGYEARTYEGAQCRRMTCRDFSGTHPIVKLVANLNVLGSALVEKFRKAPEGKVSVPALK
jgi:hypothetical protein